MSDYVKLPVGKRRGARTEVLRPVEGSGVEHFEPVLLKYVEYENSHTLDFYTSHGGYDAAKKAIADYKPDDLIDFVKSSGLRGRGGAGFPAGLKWSFVPKESAKPKYLAVNADESEPGTFKDRSIIEYDPHQLLEGIIICCYAVGIHTAYIYIRGEFVFGARALEEAIEEAYAGGYLGKNIMGTGFDLDVTVHRGAGAYICGEETGLLSSLEGNRGNPKIKPPFPAVEGLFRSPTVVNNVETLANLPHIINNGIDWYKGMGTDASPGSKIFCLSGHMKHMGLVEVPLGMSLTTMIEAYGGGMIDDLKLKAVIPGGSSAPVLAACDCEVPLCFDACRDAGTMLGSGGVIAMHENTCMVNALWNLLRFYAHESCGQCTPCREGTGWIEKIVARIERGQGRMADLQLLLDICDEMCGRTICVLADAAAFPTRSFIKCFREEFEAHIEAGCCPINEVRAEAMATA